MTWAAADPLNVFIEGWGRMGTHWGVGRMMAKIQALLYLSPRPLSLEDISRTLKTSRSNVSMNVRALQDLGVVRKVALSGDRKDYYAAEPDIAKVARRLAAEKKKRELDPALDIVDRILCAMPRGGAPSGSGERGPVDSTRLLELKALLETIAEVFDAFIESSEPNLGSRRIAPTSNV